MADTKITKAKLAARLRVAGFEASRQTTTAVRGWYNFSSGYVVDADGSTYGSVRFRSNYGASVERAKEMANLYASALIADGFNVELKDDGKLVVITAEEDAATKTKNKIAELQVAIKATEDHLDDMWKKGGVLALVVLSDKVERLQKEVNALRSQELKDKIAALESQWKGLASFYGEDTDLTTVPKLVAIDDEIRQLESHLNIVTNNVVS